MENIRLDFDRIRKVLPGFAFPIEVALVDGLDGELVDGFEVGFDFEDPFGFAGARLVGYFWCGWSWCLYGWWSDWAEDDAVEVVARCGGHG